MSDDHWDFAVSPFAGGCGDRDVEPVPMLDQVLENESAREWFGEFRPRITAGKVPGGYRAYIDFVWDVWIFDAISKVVDVSEDEGPMALVSAIRECAGTFRRGMVVRTKGKATKIDHEPHINMGFVL